MVRDISKTRRTSSLQALFSFVFIISLFLSQSQVLGYGKTHAHITEEAFSVWPDDDMHEIHDFLKPVNEDDLEQLQNHKAIGSEGHG